MTERETDVLREMRPVIRPWLDHGVEALPQGEQLPDRVYEHVVAEMRASARGRDRGRVNRIAPVFGPAKFVLAAVIVALFGGFLLVGLLDQQSSEGPGPAAASASPSPTSTEDVLSGFVLEEVEPGILRVVSDGIRDLPAHTQDVGGFGGLDPVSIVAGLDGSVWHVLGAELYRLGDEATHAWSADAPLRVGDEDIEVSAEGTLWVATPSRPDALGPDHTLWSLDEAGWSQHLSESDDGIDQVEVTSDGAVYASSPSGVFRVDGVAPVKVSQPDGQDADFPGLSEDVSFAVSDDGTRWLFSPSALGVYRDEGNGWQRLDLDDLERDMVYQGRDPVATGSDPDRQVSVVADAGPDGTVWIQIRATVGGRSFGANIRGNGALLDSDESDWSAESGPSLPSASGLSGDWKTSLVGSADGSAWMVPADETDPSACLGITQLDPYASQYLTDLCVYSFDIAPDGTLWAIAGPQPDSADGPLATYVIRPQDVARRASIEEPPANDESPGELVTEYVEPGVVRVISDGHRTVSWPDDVVAAGEPSESDPSPYPVGDSRVIVRADGRVWVVLINGFYELGREPMVEFPGHDFMTFDDQVAVGPDGSFYKLLGWRPQSWKPAGKGELWRHDGSGWTPEEVEPGSATAERLSTVPDGSIQATRGGRVFQRHDSGWTRVSDTADGDQGGTPATSDGETQPLVRLGDEDEQSCAGLERSDGEAWQHYLADLCIFDFDVGPDGRIWAIADDEPRTAEGSGGLYIIDPSTAVATE